MTGTKAILVTRPLQDAEPLASKLAFKGYQVLCQPMLTIQFEEDAADELNTLLEEDAPPQAIIITSANGARALAHMTTSRHIPVITVGEASAEEAKARGFWYVTPAVEGKGGDVEQLIAYVSRTLSKDKGALLHVSGHEVTGDLTGRLKAQGFATKRIIVYRAAAASHLNDDIHEALQLGTLHAVTFYSSRTAQAFIRLIQKEKLEPALAAMRAYCLSPAIAGTLDAEQWQSVLVADTPDSETLLALIEATESTITAE